MMNNLIILAFYFSLFTASTLGVFGNTSYTCDEDGLHAAVANGGDVKFDCKDGPVTVYVSNTVSLVRPVSIDGGRLLTL